MPRNMITNVPVVPCSRPYMTKVRNNMLKPWVARTAINVTRYQLIA